MLTRVIKILALAAMAAGSFGSSAGAQEKQALKLENAKLVYEEMIDEREGGVPPSLRADAKCVAVIPRVVKGGFLVGGRHGNGVMSCRDEAGVWSPPVFIEIKGVSLGLQVGGQSSDLVLFFMSEKAARSLMTSKFTLGGDASVAAGPVGRETQPNSDPNVKAEIYSYARVRGLFAGVSLQGSHLAPDQKAIESYYGERIFPEKIVFEHRVPRNPPEARAFAESLP
ncbi:MAG: lipid-binding SYLF domain-containing protein [Thermoanaerobaculia bacterium]